MDKKCLTSKWNNRWDNLDKLKLDSWTSNKRSWTTFITLFLSVKDPLKLWDHVLKNVEKDFSNKSAALVLMPGWTKHKPKENSGTHVSINPLLLLTSAWTSQTCLLPSTVLTLEHLKSLHSPWELYWQLLVSTERLQVKLNHNDDF